MNNKRFATILVVVAVVMTSLACSLGGVTIGKNAAQITVTLNEDQINEMIERSNRNINDDDILLDDITGIDMQDGLIRVYGTYDRDGSTAEGSYDVKVAADNGALKVEIVGVDIEGVELDDRRITRTNDEIAESLQDSADQSQGEVEFNSIDIDDDSMTITITIMNNRRDNQ